MIDATVELPEQVVFKTFVEQTVMLNLSTGQYHALNAVGGRMLEVLKAVGSVRRAARQLAAEFGRDVAEIEADLEEFCLSLEERELIRLRAE